MADIFESHGAGLDSPARRAFVISPSDAADLAIATRGIYTGSGGSITVVLVGDTDPVTFASTPAGIILPLRVKKVMATNTDAADLVGLA